MFHRRLLSSSPFFGVCVRPWSSSPCGGGKESVSSTLMVDLALHELGKASIEDPLSNTALDNTKLGNPIPSAPPWTIICPTQLGDPYSLIRTPRFVLGATAISICIIASPDMKNLFPYLDFPLETLISVRSFYIKDFVASHKVQFTQYPHQFIPFIVPIRNLHIPLTTQSHPAHPPDPPSACSPYWSQPFVPMEELTKTLSANLNLIEIETKIHSFTEPSELPEDENREEPSAFLAVKLLTTCHFNPEAFKKRLKEMWPEHFSINVLEKEPNFFTVEFGCFGDRRRVLIGQPWHFDFKLIVMSPLEAGSVVTTDMLTSTPFWIQVSEFLAKCDSSSAPPLLQYDHTLGAKICITSNPFYIASTRTRLSPHVSNPVSLAPPPNPRPPTNQIISEPPYNDPSSEYGVQYFHQPRTTPVGCYMTQVPQNTSFIRDLYGANTSPSFSAWPNSGNVVDLDSPSQSHRPALPLPYPIINDQNAHINNNMSLPEQVATSNPIVASPTITNAMNTTDTTGYTVPVSQAFATIMADLNANQPLHFTIGSSFSPATASPSVCLLHRIGSTIHNSPWLVVGDFNDYLNSHDKIGGDTSRAPSTQFCNFLDSFTLHDIKYTGHPFTWTNKPGQQSHTQEHIDWAISNAEWDSLFPKHHLLHEDYFGSDHRPLILNLHHLPASQNHNNWFFFDKLWMDELDFEDCLLQAWSFNHHSNTTDPIANLAGKLKQCLMHLTKWKKSLGPSISSKIREIQYNLKQSWHCRNEYLHHQKLTVPALVIQTTSDYLNLYQQNNTHLATPGFHPSSSAAATHEDPPTFNLKLSVDAAQNINSNMTGFGMALFNNKVLVDYIYSEASHHLLLNRYTKDIRNFLSYIPNAKLIHISREHNEEAHRLAKFALGLVQEVYWKDHNFICNL
ncbi:hypothetical protein G4B88_019210 [Cannabis sativa]|uniref:RNase H type-1 domain-containing protein n=1 Tax=Cannabis sativa TaxID=3483 RepID=A0A7J6HQ05_CANSA|nr:hypothetical protein G4B88_019210 [Cannabis sativa]